MDANATPNIVLVHDWLTGMRGGEKCLDVLCRRWPEAQLFTLLHASGSVSPTHRTTPAHNRSFLSTIYRVSKTLLSLSAAPNAAGGQRAAATAAGRPA